MKSDLFDFTARVVHETPKAWLLDHGGTSPVWLPKSGCEVEINRDGSTVTVTCRAALAEAKGIV